MQRVIAAGLLGLLLATSAPAQSPGCAAGEVGPGAYSWGYGHPSRAHPDLGKVISNPIHGCSHNGCGGFCFRLFPGFHQEGPLFNYGPYAGYYPFEPYGPWTSDLRYTGPLGPPGGNCGPNGCGGGLGSHLHGLGDKLHSLGGHFHKNDGCSTCGGYAKATLHNVGHRVNPFGHCHGKSGCNSCAGSTGVVEGETVTAAPEHVAEAPKPENPVVQAGYPRRER